MGRRGNLGIWWAAALCYLAAAAVVEGANLSAPTSLTATAVSTSQINLTWQDSNTNESGFSIERSTSSTSGFVAIGTTGKDVKNFSSTGLAAGVRYYYRVKATAKGNGSAAPYSNVASAVTQSAGTGIPAAPSNLQAAGMSSSTISLSWSDNSTNETAFKVERATSSAGPFSQIGTTAAAGYGDSGLSPSTTYYYRVRSYNASGNSGYTNTASATTHAGSAVGAPAAPTGLAATAASASQINLSWNDNSSNESGFKVERSTATSAWAQIGTTGVNVRTFSSTGLSGGVTYSYRVRAYNSSGDSAYSNAASATTGSGSGSRWSKQFGDTTEDRTRFVAVDGNGNVAVTGYFDGITNFGGGLITSFVHTSMGPTRDVFVARYNSSGGHIWSRAIGGVGSEEGNAVAMDSSGNVAVTGYQGSFQVDYGGGIQPAAGGNDIFIAKYSASGSWVWSKTIGGTGNESGNGVATDGSGNVIVTGGVDASTYGVNFGGGALMSAGLQDVFVAKYTASGGHVWSKRWGGSLSESGVAVDTDASGNIYVTGNFEGSINFGGGALSSAGGKEVFVVKLDPSGNHIWSKKFGSTGNDWAGGLAIDSTGNVAISGRFVNSINFGGGTLTSVGGEDGYLAKLSGASGAHTWSKRFGGTTNDSAAAVAADGSGNVVVSGHYNGSVDFGGGALQSYSIDVFAAKYNSAGGHVWSRRYGDSNYQFGTAVGAATNGDVVIGGYFNYSIDFGTGLLSSIGGSTFDAFLSALGP